MNILTTEERKELQAGHYNSPAQFFDAIAAAVINRLAAGVSVEPSAYRFTENRGNGNTEFNYYGLDEVGMAYRDNCLEITPLYTATAIAAARVQTIRNCEAAIKSSTKGWGNSANEVGLFAALDALRALLGKEAT